MSCSTSMSSMPAALLLLSVAIPFLCSFSVNGLVGMFPLPLTSSWCTTWLALTKHGGVGVVGSLSDAFDCLTRVPAVMRQIN